MEKQRIHAGGIDFVYEECGSSNSKVIVLLHGFCGSSLYWHKICPVLSEQYRVIIPNLRGHGGSQSPEGTYSMEMMAEDIAMLLESLQIDKVVMFGHSLGGYVTAAFAERYPDRLSGFALIHSTALPDTEAAKEKRRQDMADIRANGITPYVRGIIPNLFKEEKLEELHDEVDQLIGVGQQMTEQAAISTLEGMMQRPDRSHVLAEAKYPVLLVAGAEDAVVKPDDTFTVTNLHEAETTYKYPHILETTFEDVAHMSLVEVSDQLARVMATYLQTLYEREENRTEGKTDVASGK
ncbi:alpha/beta hydrolase [Paenibacillus alkaliterrae]|uniref:alpha/beta fold hydrolase n=1 Tax=Paenibacillus alkaliterrae TaxID=320909 RepID=UPI001F1890F8|nr:alpha/beta hydrolase [Paenibacillus alkaliterrae]MCF2939688.1 alpha/beta hydrolase [Paenibacillus alkaliterrae]